MTMALCHLFPAATPGEREHGEQVMDRATARRFVEAWGANWRKVDIDAVVAHFAENAEMRSPLALELTESPVVAGAENIRAYWRRAYGGIKKSADLKILNWSWDD